MNELAFLNDKLVQDAVIRNFEIIGEASNNIEMHYPEFASAHPELPLAFVYQICNAVAHGYFKVDFEIVWETTARIIGWVIPLSAWVHKGERLPRRSFGALPYGTPRSW